MRGAKPKTYPPEMVADVARLYAGGLSQSEVAAALRTTQRVVHRLMVRHGLPRRPQIKRNQSGERNPQWKGGAAKYAALHLRVANLRGKPSLCEHCGTTESPAFDWANLTGRFDDPNDYVRLCRSCHHRMDGKVRNFRGGRHAV